MKTTKYILLSFLLLFAVDAFAQSGYDIHNTTVSEKFNSDNELQSRHIWASGVRDKEVLNIDMTVDVDNVIKTLIVNDKEIEPSLFPAFKGLTDYVIKFIDGEAQEANSEPAAAKPTASGQTSDIDKKALMELIKAELIKDELIDNPKVFDFMLTYDSLYINAKKQADIVFRKYKILYDQYSTVPLTETTYFQITQTL